MAQKAALAPIADVILIDEAQDTNPVCAGIIQNFIANKQNIILVGDTYQEIYQFRGTTNLLKPAYQPKDTVWERLTTSFRFPQSIANVANRIIKCDPPIFGAKPEPNVPTVQTVEKFPNLPYCYIVRKNSEIYEILLSRTNKRLEIIGDTRPLQEELWGLYNFKKQGKSDKRQYKMYASWHDYTENVTKNNDIEALRLIKLLPFAVTLINKLKECTKVVDPDVIITTAHKAKGLEFPIVTLSPYFTSLWEMVTRGEQPFIPYAERNLFYVAATRAQKQLLFYAPPPTTSATNED